MSERPTHPLIDWLQQLDRGAQANLRRSLAFTPGAWPKAFPYVEPFVRERSPWDRSVAYLVAGLVVSSRVHSGQGDLGAAAFRLRMKTASRSVEDRFIALLDADDEQLPHRLRQMITLMAAHEIAPDWSGLLRDLERWNHRDRRIQQRWAASYYAQDAEARGNESSDPEDASGVEDAETEA